MLPDDSAVLTLCDGALVPLAARVAWELGLFEQLADGSRTVYEVAAALGLAERPVEILAAAAASLGLVRREADHLTLCPAARSYLLRESQWSMTPLLDLVRAAAFDAPLTAMLRRAVESDQPQVELGAGWTERLAADRSFAELFTAAMEAHSRPAALAWPRHIPLESHRRLLDVGGGSGIHAASALAVHPGLEAVVLELPAVAAAAERQGAGSAAARLRFVGGDMWQDGWPEADLHFFGDVFHDWPLDRCGELAARSFAALPPGGRIVVHELLLDDDRSGPLPVVASSVAMLLWTGGRQYSAAELRGLLAAAGFVEITATRSLGCWGVVSGVRP
jgi:hypothetical protein